MLDQDGFWGPGVLLNERPSPNTESHSITRWVAYWAGGTDPQDRGEPTAISVRTLSELFTAVTKAACLNNRGARGDYPVSAPVDPKAMKPLVKGAPAVLKLYFIAKRDEIRQNIEHNAQEGQGSQTLLWPIPTWADLMRGIVNHSWEMGWRERTPAGLSWANTDSRQIWQVRQTSQNPWHFPQTHKPPGEVVDPQKRHNEPWKKGLALGIPRVAIQGQLTGTTLSLIQAFEKQRL